VKLQVSHHSDDSMRGIYDRNMCTGNLIYACSTGIIHKYQTRIRSLDDKRASTFQSLPPTFFASNSLTGNNERKFFFYILSRQKCFSTKSCRAASFCFSQQKKMFFYVLILWPEKKDGCHAIKTDSRYNLGSFFVWGLIYTFEK